VGRTAKRALKKRLALASAGALLAIAGGALAWSAFEKPVPAGARGESPCQFVPGAEMGWRYSLVSTFSATGERTERIARLQLSAISRSVLVGRISDPQRPELSAPFLIRISDRCELTGFARARGVPVTAARLQEEMLYQLWFRIPDAPGEAAIGEDASGQFAAVLDGDSELAQRRISAYTRMWSAEPLPRVEDSLLAARLQRGRWFQSLHGVEQRSAQGGSIRTELSLSPIDPDPAAFAGAKRSEAEYVWESLLEGGEVESLGLR
jgi:hypothetical protein